MPRPENGRRTARRLYPIIGDCERGCGDKAVERHHIDGDTTNNVRSNVLFLCRRCHMKEDGRLDTFMETSRSKRGYLPPQPCVNCGAMVTRRWHGQCHSCNEYERRRGVKRPYKEDGRIEKMAVTHALPCKRCGRRADVVGNPIKGYCKSCYTYLHRNGLPI